MFKPSRLLIGLIFFAQALLGDSISQNFIFDFNGVLMGTNSAASLKKVGLANIIQCIVQLKKNPFIIDTHIKSKLFETLDHAADVYGFDTNKSQLAYDEMGNPLPYFMRAWLDGSMTCYEIKKYSLHAMATHPEWFEHSAEKQAICNLIKTIFTPEQFVETRIIHQACITFIKACKKRGHKVFALSNWDKESFVLLQKKYPDIFNLFDGIIISGEVNALKPSHDIYKTLLTRYNLTPDTCWFIDDQQENVMAASELGIHGILCEPKKFTKKPNFRLVAQTIKNTVMLERHASICEKTVESVPV